jgi:hypothetical protein
VDVDDLRDASPVDLLAAGGWSVTHARMVRVVTEGDEALVLIDTNGDRTDFAADIWRRTPSGWEEIASTDVGFGASTGGHDRLLWTIGVGPRGERVIVAVHDGVREVDVDEHGHWVVAEDREARPPYPRIVG